MLINRYRVASSPCVLAILCCGIAGLSGCDAFGTGDNAPTVFDTPQEQAARDERRSNSPAVAVYGKPYVFIDATINGENNAPTTVPSPRITLEDRLIKGFDGCHAISAETGIFSPSGYEFSLMDSGPLLKPAQIERDSCAGAQSQPWMAMYALENRVWSLRIDAQGVLHLTDYEGGPDAFRLRAAEDPSL